MAAHDHDFDLTHCRLSGAGFGGAMFTGIAPFGSTVTFAGPEPERACWVRLDVSDEVVDRRAWPAGWVVTPVAERPAPDAAGAWRRLVKQTAPDPS